MTQNFPRVRDSNQNWCFQAQVWRHMPVMSALVSQRQENYSKCKFNSVYPALPDRLFGNLRKEQSVQCGADALLERTLRGKTPYVIQPVSGNRKSHSQSPSLQVQAQPPLRAYKTKPQTMTQYLNALSISWPLLFGRALELYYCFVSD